MSQQRVVSSTYIDSMTGLLNREGIESVLEEYYGKARLSQQPLSVVYIDVDGLKAMNDTHNTDVGDKAIIATASAIKEETLPTWRDKAGKWKEGDEFIVVLPGTVISLASEIAERIRSAVESRTIQGLDGDNVPISVSIGVVQTRDTDGSGHELVIRAEQAKTRAKEAGKNQVVVEE